MIEKKMAKKQPFLKDNGTDLDALRATHYNATLTFIKEVTPNLRILRIKPDGELPRYEPGQFTTLGLLGGEGCVIDCAYESNQEKKDKLFLRAYSMSHPIIHLTTGKLLGDKESDCFEFYVVLVNKEPKEARTPVLTPRLFSLHQGDRLFMGKISGHYKLLADEVSKNKHLIFCSTGTGEAPHNAMIWTLLRNNYKGKITAIVCVRSSLDLAYLDTYQKLQREFPNLSYITLTTRDSNAPKRYIQDLLESKELEKTFKTKITPDTHAFYLCGNPSMIGIPKVDPSSGTKVFPPGRKGMVEILEGMGFTADHGQTHGNIHFEKYW